jgi:hypothetical protein
MTEFEPPKVLVGVDGSESGMGALAWARNYVRAVGGHLTAIIAWHYPPMPTGPGVVPRRTTTRRGPHDRCWSRRSPRATTGTSPRPSDG